MRWQEYTEELYKKDFHDPDNHNGVITLLEPDILECELQWAVRKHSSVVNAKKYRKTIEWERLEISARKLEIPRGHFMQRWAQ